MACRIRGGAVGVAVLALALGGCAAERARTRGAVGVGDAPSVATVPPPPSPVPEPRSRAGESPPSPPASRARPPRIPAPPPTPSPARVPLPGLPAVAPLPPEPERPRIAVPDRTEVRQVVAEYTGPLRRSFADALRRGGRYLPMIRSVLRSEGLPAELAYLPLVESHFRLDARSHAGAVGLWQFIASTGRASGLRIDWWVDQRLDPEAATRAAARHLRELHQIFGDWELALAAYNAGPGGVGRALGRSGAEDYWGLCRGDSLRAETRRYLPKFYAAVLVGGDPARYGFDPADRDAPAEWDTLEVDSPVDLVTLARFTDASVALLRALNPALKRDCTPPGKDSFPVRVPRGTAEIAAARLAAVPREERLTFLRHRVRAGDTLWDIARRYGTHHRAIAELNRVGSARALRPGQDLVVPVRSGRSAGGEGNRPSASARAGGHPVHVVRPGDTLWGISRTYGVSVAGLRRWNGLSAARVLRPGDVLALGPEARGDAVSTGVRVYVVGKGDTLWEIARRHGTPLADLLERNGLRADSVIRPGDRLVLTGEGPDST